MSVQPDNHLEPPDDDDWLQRVIMLVIILGLFGVFACLCTGR